MFHCFAQQLKLYIIKTVALDFRIVMAHGFREFSAKHLCLEMTVMQKGERPTQI